ncbi:sensor histidine kinase [Paenibacillus sp. CC-CFT747]|nr:sensor histidine kinase [Paenibacillus sp. CC-CFT747]
MGGTAGLLALGFTLVLSRRFTRPIRELLQLMSGYALNRSVQTYPTRYHNEFGSLFGGYRKLVERIEDLYASLELQYKAQREAEIRALQAMINPHFLYNTLDQLNWMAIEAGQDRISHVLELMGRMFRIGLSNGESFIPLEDELMHTECYLQIQQLKWGEGLHYSIDCPPELRALLVPKLTIQPFVENAVIHGFHGRRTGTVAIRVQEYPEGVRLTVTDDGRGLPDGWETKPRRKTGATAYAT